jgi:hypothetical protein
MRKSVRAKIERILEYIVIAQKNFNYKYYLSKNCPLPENWKEKKQLLIEAAKKDADTRGKVYKELFEYSSSNRQVADFFTEFIANVFPKDFLEGKNKKVFNKKVL